MTPDALNREIAQRLFQWRDDEHWGGLVPPDWPTKTSALCTYTAWQTMHTIAQAAGCTYGRVSGVPLVPDYLTDPRATARVWQWLEAHCRTIFLRWTGTSWHIECEGKPPGEAWFVAAAASRRAEALCRAALAAVDVIQIDVLP